MEIYEINSCNQTIRFELQRKKVKNINLRLKPDMRVVVSANKKVPLTVINSFVKSKATWIVKNLQRLTERQDEMLREKEYVSGEEFRYMGRQLRLKVREGEAESVQVAGDYLELTVKDKNDAKRKEKLVNRWYKDEAVRIFCEIMAYLYPVMATYGAPRPIMKIRKMKSRWGSCMPKRAVITLNLYLIYAPKRCIEYVILHELVHFLHLHHDVRFHGMMTSLMPDWKERKRVLNERT